MGSTATTKSGRDWLTKSAKIFAAFALLIFLAALFAAPSQDKSISIEKVGSLVESNTAFGIDLFTQLRKKEGNLIFSPYSISTCLAMTMAGARGNTEQQMIKTLHFETNQIHTTFGRLQRQLRSVPNGTEVTIANGLWAQSGHPFIPQFLSLVQQEYEAKVNQADFRWASAVASEINSWVSSKTRGKLSNMVPPELLDQYSRLVIVNAIYFKGTWQTRFNPGQTMERDFHLDESRMVKCQMMHCTGKFRSGRFSPDCEAIELPYQGNAFSMIVLLPIDWDGLKNLEAKLTNHNIESWIGALREPDKAADVFLPKFQFQTGFELNNTLAAMGTTDAFGTNADFSGIDGTTNLFIRDVLHRAFVEVDEEGTRAGAATASDLRARGLPPQFLVDHPFLFLILENRTGGILFLGRVANPTRV
jgi:serine protease inhibitor